MRKYRKDCCISEFPLLIGLKSFDRQPHLAEYEFICPSWSLQQTTSVCVEKRTQKCISELVSYRFSIEWREALENKPKVMKKQSRSQRTASRKVSNTCALQQIVLKSPIYRNSDCWRRNFKSLPFKRDQNQDRTPDVSRAAFNLPRVLQWSAF